MAFAQHDASDNHQRRRGDSPLLGAQQSGDGHVAAGFYLAVRLHDDPAPQSVLHKDLLRLCDPELPRQSCMLDRRERRRPGAPRIARYEYHVAVAL